MSTKPRFPDPVTPMALQNTQDAMRLETAAKRHAACQVYALLRRAVHAARQTVARLQALRSRMPAHSVEA